MADRLFSYQKILIPGAEADDGGGFFAVFEVLSFEHPIMNILYNFYLILFIIKKRFYYF